MFEPKAFIRKLRLQKGEKGRTHGRLRLSIGSKALGFRAAGFQDLGHAEAIVGFDILKPSLAVPCNGVSVLLLGKFGFCPLGRGGVGGAGGVCYLVRRGLLLMPLLLRLVVFWSVAASAPPAAALQVLQMQTWWLSLWQLT